MLAGVLGLGMVPAVGLVAANTDVAEATIAAPATDNQAAVESVQASFSTNDGFLTINFDEPTVKGTDYLVTIDFDLDTVDGTDGEWTTATSTSYAGNLDKTYVAHFVGDGTATVSNIQFMTKGSVASASTDYSTGSNILMGKVPTDLYVLSSASGNTHPSAASNNLGAKFTMSTSSDQEVTQGTADLNVAVDVYAYGETLAANTVPTEALLAQNGVKISQSSLNLSDVAAATMTGTGTKNKSATGAYAANSATTGAQWTYDVSQATGGAIALGAIDGYYGIDYSAAGSVVLEVTPDADVPFEGIQVIKTATDGTYMGTQYIGLATILGTPSFGCTFGPSGAFSFLGGNAYG